MGSSCAHPFRDEPAPRIQSTRGEPCELVLWTRAKPGQHMSGLGAPPCWLQLRECSFSVFPAKPWDFAPSTLQELPPKPPFFLLCINNDTDLERLSVPLHHRSQVLPGPQIPFSVCLRFFSLIYCALLTLQVATVGVLPKAISVL